MQGAAIIAVLLAAGVAAQTAIKLPPKTLPPVSHEGRDKSLVTFMDRLRAAVKNKSGLALMQLVSPDIKNGFGGEDGTAAFVSTWRPYDPASNVFGIYANILTLGGDFFAPDQYCIPYIALHWPDEVDPTNHHVVTGTNIRLRAEPSTTGQVVASLSWDIVETLSRENEWSRVKTLDGKEGYVSTAYLYGPLAYRSCFLKGEDGQWRIRSLVAGD